MSTYPGKRPSYREVLEHARQLPLRDQQRLREELSIHPGVNVVYPSRDPKVIHTARILAEKVRKTVQSATLDQSLDDTMRQLRDVHGHIKHNIRNHLSV